MKTRIFSRMRERSAGLKKLYENDVNDLKSITSSHNRKKVLLRQANIKIRYMTVVCKMKRMSVDINT